MSVWPASKSKGSDHAPIRTHVHSPACGPRPRNDSAGVLAYAGVESIGGTVVSENIPVPHTTGSRFMFYSTATGALYVTIILDDTCVVVTAALAGPYVPTLGV